MYLALKYILQHVVKAIIFIEPDRTEGRITYKYRYKSKGVSLFWTKILFQRFRLFCKQESRSTVVTLKREVCATQWMQSSLIITELNILICGVLINNCFALCREESYSSFLEQHC